MLILTCEQCRKEFGARKRGYRFCSRACHNDSMRHLDLKRLTEMAGKGELGKNIAMDLGVTRGRVHHALRTHGLYEQWRALRYA